MNKLSITMLTTALLALMPLEAATIVKNYEEAAKSVGKDGYVVFAYGANWDPTGLKVCQKHMDSSAVKVPPGMP